MAIVQFITKALESRDVGIFGRCSIKRKKILGIIKVLRLIAHACIEILIISFDREYPLKDEPFIEDSITGESMIGFCAKNSDFSRPDFNNETFHAIIFARLLNPHSLSLPLLINPSIFVDPRRKYFSVMLSLR